MFVCACFFLYQHASTGLAMRVGRPSHRTSSVAGGIGDACASPTAHDRQGEGFEGVHDDIFKLTLLIAQTSETEPCPYVLYHKSSKFCGGRLTFSENVCFGY